MVINNMIYPLFSVVGIEVEYMIVDKASLDIRPIADEVIKAIAGHYTNEIECGPIAINNELALHVLELKTNGPAPSINGLDKVFQIEIDHLNRVLEGFNAQLMPGGTHPWMDPMNGVKLWPHGNRSIYETYDRIFDCRGHGWSNLQSIHINLPFANDEEFSKLHNAIRLLIPLIPALCASTPFIEGKKGAALCMRLMHYGKNQIKIPMISGQVIPEFIRSHMEYVDKILNPMYRAIASEDPQQILHEEWLNSRGAIARFERNAIEIRVVDSQECAVADLAIAGAIERAIRYLIQESDAYLTDPLDTTLLRQIYDASIREGFSVEVNEKSFLAQFNLGRHRSLTLRQIWEHLMTKSMSALDHPYQVVLENRLSEGSLAERLIKAVGKPVTAVGLKQIYSLLCECLKQNAPFTAEFSRSFPTRVLL